LGDGWKGAHGWKFGGQLDIDWEVATVRRNRRAIEEVSIFGGLMK
jgi:hypothetical protein